MYQNKACFIPTWVFTEPTETAEGGKKGVGGWVLCPSAAPSSPNVTGARAPVVAAFVSRAKHVPTPFSLPQICVVAVIIEVAS